ncbi:DUF3710 domain-containing protein [Cellulomonas massiliensis]|uniref:DUF3710 domain-containing protein n=1 Tax=Cellulomonas massiliensis TaxID=1465811 RepID=UPI0002F86FFE|nr:DUF3710 domain-containing protein [Cellulomonas massiliensis]
MGLFRRGAKDDAPEGAVDGVEEVEAAPAAPARERGPWDSDEPHDDRTRVDLGALRVPGVDGMELRMEVDRTTNVVSSVTIGIDGSTVTLQAYAAPRSEGIWDEIRAELAESVEREGGSVDDLPGPFGRELLARLPIRTAEGRTGHRPARFVGVDGPRWFLRGVFTGHAAVDPERAATLEDLFAGVVVVRGADARPPRDLLALTLPGQPGAPAATEKPAFDPLTRGPEITEIR